MTSDESDFENVCRKENVGHFEHCNYGDSIPFSHMSSNGSFLVKYEKTVVVSFVICDKFEL